MTELPSGAVTILATDLERSVGLWDDDEEAMSEALARHDWLLRELVAHHQGYAIKGTGDGLWAAFEHPREALDTAIEIQHAMRTTDWGELGQLRVRVAVHTGDLEWRDGDVYGATANRVARMLGLADGGQIFTSEATIRLAGIDQVGAYDIRDLGPKTLRGMRQPLHLFELVPGDPAPDSVRGVAVFRPPTHSVALDHTPLVSRAFEPAYPFPVPDLLVGRQGDLLTVRRALERGRREGQTILIGAPAGTGKSTLAGIFVRQARAMGFLCLAGGSFDQESPTPYGPVRDALCDYLLSLPPVELRSRFGDRTVDLEPIIPELRYHLSHRTVQSPWPTESGRISAALHSCLRVMAARQPVLLCLEDLHATDGATLELFHNLARQTRRLAIVILATFRVEEVARDRPLSRLINRLNRDQLAQRIDLQALNESDTTTLISSLLGGPVSREIVDSLFAVTEGNPLFVEQLVLSLREEDRFERRDGVWSHVALDEASVPPVIQDVIERRFDHLGTDDRSTLAMAAVLGQTFDLQSLSATLAAPDGAAVVAILDQAIRAQLVSETATGYRFNHAMIRESLYRRLSRRQRAQLHALAGDAIEQLAGERAGERAAELALHFTLASAVAPTTVKALHYSLEAGRQAIALTAHREAFEHFSRAHAMIEREPSLGDRDVRLDALDGRGQAERDLADWRGCITTYRQILTLSNDLSRRGRAHDVIGRALLQIGDLSSAINEFETGLAELRHAGDGPQVEAARLGLMYQTAFPTLLQGKTATALQLGLQMLPVAERLAQPQLLSNAHSVMAIAYMRQGQADEAEQHYVEACAAAEQLGDRVVLALVHENLAAHRYLVGDFAAARDQIQQVRDLLREPVNERRWILSIRLLALIALAEGDLARAYEQAHLAYTLAVESGDRLVGECSEVLGTIHSARGEWDAAIGLFEQALSTYERIGNVRELPNALHGLGNVYELQGDRVQAMEQYRTALDVTGQMEPSPNSVAAHRHLGRCLLRRDDPEATEHIQRAHALAVTMPRSLEYAPTMLAMAELTSRHNPRSALEYAERALAPARTAEHLVESRFALATLCVALGHQELAQTHARECVAVAERMGSTRAQGLAQVALGRVATDSTVRRLYFDAAMQHFASARIPFERHLMGHDDGGSPGQLMGAVLLTPCPAG